MIGRMPTRQVIAMLQGAGAREAARILRSVPPDRVGVLLAEMDISSVARLILAADRDQAEMMLRAVPSERFVPVISCMSMRQLTDLIGTLPPDLAARCLEAVPAQAAAEVVSELPEPVQGRLVDLMAAQHRGDVSRAMYQRNAQESVVRIATRASWLDQATGDLLVVALNRTLQVSVRHRHAPPFTQADIDSIVFNAAWSRIAGLIVMTNVAPEPGAEWQARQLRSSGRPVEILRWLDRRDDGTLKRAIVRLVS